MRQAPAEAITLIKHYEGFYPQVYNCPAGLPTVGYGHLVRGGEDFGAGITEAEAEELLQQDLYNAERSVLALASVPLTDGQFGALVSFTYNLGSGALQRSTLRQRLNRSDYLGAADEFSKWVFSGSRKLRGLVLRRADERLLFLGTSMVQAEETPGDTEAV